MDQRRESKTRKFFTDANYAQSWAKKVRQSDYSQGYEDACIELLEIEQGTRVLEIGTGEGRLIPRILARGSKYTGVDISKHMLEIAKGRIEDREKIDLVVADGDSLPFRTDSFHSTLSLATMFFMSNQSDVLTEIARVTRASAVVEFRNVFSALGSLREFSAHLRYLVTCKGMILEWMLRSPTWIRIMKKSIDPETITRLTRRASAGRVLAPYFPLSTSHIMNAFRQGGMNVLTIQTLDIRTQGKSLVGWNTSPLKRFRPALVAKAVKQNRPLSRRGVNIAIVTHDTTLTGPSDALIKYLSGKSWIDEVVEIHYPLLHNHSVRPYTRRWTRLASANKQFLFDPNVPDWALYSRDLFGTGIVLLHSKKRIDVYVATNALNLLMGLFLRRLGYVRYVVFYSIDFVPRRFQNRFENRIYHMIHRLAARSADYLWNLSPKMSEIHRAQGATVERSFLVPIGIEGRHARDVPHLQENHSKLVFIGNLTEPKGLQLAIEAMPEILDRVPSARLIIIGRGPYENALKDLTTKLGLDASVHFLGVMRYQNLLEYLPEMGIALAPYKPDANAFVRYTDPGKVKEYLGCGLPVIVTRVPDIANDIEKEAAGFVIDYDKTELADAVVKLVEDQELYEHFRENARTFASKFTWERIFDDAFAPILDRTRDMANA